MSKSPKKSKPAASGIDDEARSRSIIIKKYPNRRLYNTATSSYIVLDDLIALVKSGADFIVEDTKTGEDITRSILNQIIYEQETGSKDFLFPLEFQKQLISLYGDSYASVMPDYLTEAITLFSNQRGNIAENLESTLDRNTRAVMEYGQSLARQNMEMFKRTWDVFGLMGGTEEQPFEAKPAQSKEPEGDLDDIQAQIDALQERLKGLK